MANSQSLDAWVSLNAPENKTLQNIPKTAYSNMR